MESKTSPQGAPLDAAQLRAILASEEGRKLLALLHHTDSAALRPASAAAKSGDPDKDQSGGKKDEDAKTSSDNTDKSDSKNNPKTGDSLYITSIVLMAAVAMCTAVFAARKKDGKKAE